MRLGLGAGLTLGGVVTAGFGAAALATDGGCYAPPVPPAQQCELRYSTLPLGASTRSGANLKTAAANEKVDGPWEIPSDGPFAFGGFSFSREASAPAMIIRGRTQAGSRVSWRS